MFPLLLVGCCLLPGPPPLAAQQPPPPAPRGQAAAKAPQARPAAGPAIPPDAEAYYQFMLGRHLESEDDVAGAIAAYNEAVRLDPKAAEVRAELAALYARANKLTEALDMAESALKIDPGNASAHRILGFIYADLARVDDASTRFDAAAGANGSKAITHLEAALQGNDGPQTGLSMLLGRLYLRSGAYDKAIGVLSRVVVDEPGQPEPVDLLVQAYQQAGRLAEATAMLEAAVGLQPQFNPMLGELYERQRQWAAAARAYERAVAQAPKNLELRTRLAYTLLSTGGAAETLRAVTLLEQIRRESPADRRVLYLLAQAQQEAGQLDEAESTARQLVAVIPGSVTGASVLAGVLGRKEQYRKVVETLEPVLAGPAPTSPSAQGDLIPALLQLGFAYMELGEADRAISTFERVRASSSDTTTDIYIAQTLLMAHRYDEAVVRARAARVGRPDDQFVLRLEADALRRAGKGDEGATLLVDALAKRPDDVSAYTALAQFDVQREQFDAALGVLARAAAKFPSDLTVTFQVGAVLERRKQFAEAERKFREVLAKDPLHAPTLNYLGYMLADRGERLDEAIGYIKRALLAEPYNGAYFDSLGWAYFRQNRLDLAEANLARAAEQRVRDSAIQEHFGDLLAKLGRTKDAVSAWQRALDGDGEQVDRAALERKIRSARQKALKH